MNKFSSSKISSFIDELTENNIFNSSQSESDLINRLSDYFIDKSISINENQLHSTFKSYRLDHESLNKHQIDLLLYILLGDNDAKASMAFKLLDSTNKGYVSWNQLEKILKLLEVKQTAVDKILQEITTDGSEEISKKNFLHFLPEDFKKHPKAYESSHKGINFHTIDKKLLNTANLDKKQKDNRSNALKGTSPLQMQIGFFRLLQGAAYRSFRESFSANCETHLRSYDLPYTIKDFVCFVDKAIDYYLSLGIVSTESFSAFEDLRTSVKKLDSDLDYRMQNWNCIDKNEAMLEAERYIDEELDELDNHHQIFSVLVEIVLSSALHGHSINNISLGDLEHHEMNRLRQLEEHEEILENEISTNNNSLEYLETWNRVIVDNDNNYFEGAIVPTSYWYEEFMPLLLRATSITNHQDLINWDSIEEDALDQWFEKLNLNGEFDKYGNDLKVNFLQCSFQTKKCLKQAWILTRHYLNGVQKRRERKEFGRDSGFLSQYVAFIDVYLKRNDIEKSQMRVSFPYYIGPATWRLLHTSAEIYSLMDKTSQYKGIKCFVEFFKYFATMYPCPYCRYHLNRFVVKNKEVSMYPIEYLIIGCKNDKFNFDVSLENKLEEIRDANSLRLFLWKIHNTVSSSIARSEDWFHADKEAFYTSRYWPSLDSEIERANLLNNEMINSKDISRIYGVIKSAVHLSILKDELQLNFNNEEELKSIFEKSKKATQVLDESINVSNFLQQTYNYEPLLKDRSPHFSIAEEALARSGRYTES